MNNRRRHKGEVHNQQVQGSRSQHRKPPFHGNWQPTVPSWEKRFCYSIGLVPWRKLLETKKLMYLYENVVQWNDSAGEEAFHNAKNRFWAEINGFPCDISLPDPDIYIDKIDWNSDIDPELYLDLEREPKCNDETDKQEEVVIFGNSLLNQSFLCSGWGEVEEELQKEAGDPDHGDCGQKCYNGNPRASNVYQADEAMIKYELEDCWNESYGLKNNRKEWGSNCKDWNNVSDTSGQYWGTWEGDSRKREGDGCYMSRYRTSRFQRDEYQMDHGGWRTSGRGRKRINFIC